MSGGQVVDFEGEDVNVDRYTDLLSEASQRFLRDNLN